MEFTDRPICRICGRTNRVMTWAPTSSPRDRACASCGVAIQQLMDWTDHRPAVPFERLLERIAEIREERSKQRARRAQAS